MISPTKGHFPLYSDSIKWYNIIIVDHRIIERSGLYVRKK